MSALGSFDCYCALCSGPLGIFSIQFGSARTAALRERARAVEEKRRRVVGEEVERGKATEDARADENLNVEESWVQGIRDAEEALAQWEDVNELWDDEYEDPMGDYVPPDSASSSSSSGEVDDESMRIDDLDGDTDTIPNVLVRPRTPPTRIEISDAWSEASDITISDIWNPYGIGFVEHYTTLEDQTFDPSRLPLEHTQWIDRCRCLALNTTTQKAYFTGKGRHETFGMFAFKEPGRDANDPGSDFVPLYMWFGVPIDSGTTSFPFHEECFGVLARALGAGVYKTVNKDVLYEVMTNFLGEDSRDLGLEYGFEAKRDQFWRRTPGEKVSSCLSLVVARKGNVWESANGEFGSIRCPTRASV